MDAIHPSFVATAGLREAGSVSAGAHLPEPELSPSPALFSSECLARAEARDSSRSSPMDKRRLSSVSELHVCLQEQNLALGKEN